MVVNKKGRCCATTSNTLFSYSSTSRGKFELKVKSVLACCDHAKDMCTQTGPFQWPRVCQQKTRDPPLEQEADRRKGGHETSVIFFFFFSWRERDQDTWPTEDQHHGERNSCPPRLEPGSKTRNYLQYWSNISNDEFLTNVYSKYMGFNDFL